MKTLNSFLGRTTTTLLAVAALLCLPAASRAATVSLAVNSSLSSLSLAGGVFGIGFTPQVTGSMVDFWGGTITADLTGGTWTFTGGSVITAVLNPVGPFSTAPAPYPQIGDNYGATGTATLPTYGLSTINGAWRDLSLDITAGTAVNGVGPDVSGQALTFLAGSKLDWAAVTANFGAFPGSSSFTGISGGNLESTPVTWDGTTLTLPVLFETTGANGLDQFWSGTIVATVPEPSALALGALGLVGFLVASRNRSRARGI